MDTAHVSPRHSPPCIVNVRGSNRILTLLPKSDYERLRPLMERVSFGPRECMQTARTPISHAYFPLTGVMSLVVSMQDGSQLEAATVGNEGMLGVSLLMEAHYSTMDVFSRIAGEALSMPAAVLRQEVQRGGAFPWIMHRYAEAYVRQVAQASACNGLHPVEQRLCRWILMTHDRVGLDRLPLTQEFIAMMLGVRRASVTTTLGMLERAGYIRHQRGAIDVLDRAGLERGSCECYSVVRAELERLLCEDLDELSTPTHNRPQPVTTTRATINPL